MDGDRAFNFLAFLTLILILQWRFPAFSRSLQNVSFKAVQCQFSQCTKCFIHVHNVLKILYNIHNIFQFFIILLFNRFSLLLFDSFSLFLFDSFSLFLFDNHSFLVSFLLSDLYDFISHSVSSQYGKWALSGWWIPNGLCSYMVFQHLSPHSPRVSVQIEVLLHTRTLLHHFIAPFPNLNTKLCFPWTKCGKREIKVSLSSNKPRA